MVSRTKKSVVIYSLLLLSTVFTGDAQLIGQKQAFTNAHGFANTQGFGQGFTNTQGFTNAQFGNAQFGNAQFGNPAFPNTYAPVSTGFHAAKGYASPMYTGNQYYNYAHPVNAQYWMGHSLPAGYQQYPQPYGYQQGGYVQYGQYGQSWNYPQQYGYWGVHPAYSGQYVHYPMFNANYWTGHHQMYPIHGVPAYPYHMPYGHAPYPYYRQPYYYGRRRGFLGDFARSNLAKGLLGALVVGAIAGKVARGK